VPVLDTGASNSSDSTYSSFTLYQVGTCTTPISSAFVASYPVLIAPYDNPSSFVSVTIASTPALALTKCGAASVWYVNYLNTQQVQIATYLNGQWWFVMPGAASSNGNAASGPLALTTSSPSTTTGSGSFYSFYVDSTMQTSQVPQAYNQNVGYTGGWGVTFEAPASSYPPNTAPLFPS